MADIAGKLVRISGPMIAADGMLGVAMGEMVKVGKLGLMGEVIRIDGETAYAQVYEDTSGMFLGEPGVAPGAPFAIAVVPGRTGQTSDSLQRPLHDPQQPPNHRQSDQSRQDPGRGESKGSQGKHIMSLEHVHKRWKR